MVLTKNYLKPQLSHVTRSANIFRHSYRKVREFYSHSSVSTQIKPYLTQNASWKKRHANIAAFNDLEWPWLMYRNAKGHKASCCLSTTVEFVVCRLPLHTIVHFMLLSIYCCCCTMVVLVDLRGYNSGTEFDAHEFLLYLLSKVADDAMLVTFTWNRLSARYVLTTREQCNCRKTYGFSCECWCFCHE